MDLIKRLLFDRYDWIVPAFEVTVRLYLFKVFFMSGLTKLQSWQSTLDLFAYEYNVPLLPPNVAAVMGTGAELIFPVLILFGFLTRPAAIGLFGLNAVATLVYSQAEYFNMTGLADHLLWGAMILIYIIAGPAKLSIDHLLAKRTNSQIN